MNNLIFRVVEDNVITAILPDSYKDKYPTAIYIKGGLHRLQFIEKDNIPEKECDPYDVGTLETFNTERRLRIFRNEAIESDDFSPEVLVNNNVIEISVPQELIKRFYETTERQEQDSSDLFKNWIEQYVNEYSETIE